MMNIHIVWWYCIGFYVMCATFKVALGMAAWTLSRDAIFSFSQPAHDLKILWEKVKWGDQVYKDDDPDGSLRCYFIWDFMRKPFSWTINVNIANMIRSRSLPIPILIYFHQKYWLWETNSSFEFFSLTILEHQCGHGFLKTLNGAWISIVFNLVPGHTVPQ